MSFNTFFNEKYPDKKKHFFWLGYFFLRSKNKSCNKINYYIFTQINLKK